MPRPVTTTSNKAVWTALVLLTWYGTGCLGHSYEECVEECSQDDKYHGFTMVGNDTERVLGIVLVSYGGAVVSSLAGMVGMQSMLTDTVIRMELERHERWFLSGAVLCYVILHSERLSKYVVIKRVTSSLFIWYSQIFYHYTVLKIMTLYDLYYNLFNLAIVVTLTLISIYTLHVSTPELVVAVSGDDVGQTEGTNWFRDFIAGGKEWIRKTRGYESTLYLVKYYYILEPVKDVMGVKVYLLGTGVALTLTSVPHEHHMVKAIGLVVVAVVFAIANPFMLVRDTLYTSSMYLTMGLRYFIYANEEDDRIWPVILTLTVLKLLADCALHFVKVTTGRRSTIQHLYWSPTETLLSQKMPRQSIVSIDTTPEISNLPTYTLSISNESFANTMFLPSPPKKRATRPTLLGKTREIPSVIAVLASAVASIVSLERRIHGLMGSLLLTPPPPEAISCVSGTNLELI
eukprot:TRINITY_DN13910_c0_g1_i1.p1 TRINITY_DN13910_c0_g1~~TRINITY_DN13910_c0_g1_i1.p1  ORF type:complete len:460 (+),score=31.57 TRINITY_DN13910_c0_g1_i1:94-1473(+)